MAQIFGKLLKYIRNGLSMLKMDSEFDIRLRYVGNDVYMWEIA